jgi:hypothetical protein
MNGEVYGHHHKRTSQLQFSPLLSLRVREGRKPEKKKEREKSEIREEILQ